jgi:hypothetical protein
VSTECYCAIAEILRFRVTHPDSDVRLLTTDSDQVVSARHFGVPFITIPDTRRVLLRNSRKTECGAKPFPTRSEVRAAPFAL